ncbi:MAG TPA: hypothetical protein VFB84_20675 [Micromonosporaceae bacterium]|nr:hypothetical protein [Micromonosporaceae bacterium]
MLGADRYHVDAISIDNRLYEVWLGGARNPAAVAAAERLTGCAQVSADRLDTDQWHSLAIYLAEAGDEPAAAAIAAAADEQGRRRPQFGLAAGRLCAVMYASTPDVSVPPAEDTGSLRRFRPVAAALLART